MGLAVVAVVVLLVRFMNRDIALCRATLTGLANGQSSVQRHIDWEHLKALDVDVGLTYTQLPKNEKAGYRQAFISYFAKGFRYVAGDTQAFTNWRMQPDGSIAVDYSAKQRTLVFHVTDSWLHRRVQAIQWQ